VSVLDAVTDAIRENVDTDAMVTSFVLVASFVPPNGESSIYTETAEHQRCHETLGLLAFGTAHENARAVAPEDD
jgi:hypothetical protein